MQEMIVKISEEHETGSLALQQRLTQTPPKQPTKRGRCRLGSSCLHGTFNRSGPCCRSSGWLCATKGMSGRRCLRGNESCFIDSSDEQRAGDEKPKVLVPASPDSPSGHRWFVQKLTPAVKALVHKANEGRALRSKDNLPIGFPTETAHCLADSVMEGVLSAVLDHICMWDPPEQQEPDGIKWNHSWWWMAEVTQLGDTLEITGSKLTPERKQQIIGETLRAMGEYQERKDEEWRARDRDTTATSDPVHRASSPPASGSTGHYGEAWWHGWRPAAWYATSWDWDSSRHSSWSDAGWHCQASWQGDRR